MVILNSVKTALETNHNNRFLQATPHFTALHIPPQPLAKAVGESALRGQLWNFMWSIIPKMGPISIWGLRDVTCVDMGAHVCWGLGEGSRLSIYLST